MVQHSDIDHTGLTGAGGSVATDAIFDAKGDLAGGTGANTAGKLTVGANGTILTAASGETTGLKWVVGLPQSADLTAGNVTLTTNSVWYDLVSLTLGAAPFYYIFARCQMANGANAGWCNIQLIDAGSTQFGGGQFYANNAASSVLIEAAGKVAGSQTIKMQGRCETNGGTAYATPQGGAISGSTTARPTGLIAMPASA